MKDFIKKNYQYLLLFLFYFICLIFIYSLNRGDTVVNYGFSYAIRLKELPYKDFNMIITPLSAYLYSIGLFIYNSIITIYIEQALLLTVLTCIMKKLLNKKTIILIACLLSFFPIPFSSLIYPSYNFLLLLELFILIYLEKTVKNKDIIIGIVLGLMFLTKQTIGLVLFVPNIYYLLKKQRIFLKRVLGYLIPISIFFVYLLITKTLKEFANLCFLGLFSFGNNNTSISIIYLLLLIIGIMLLLYKIIKDPKKIINYYILLFSCVAIPIIDYYHVALFLIPVIYVVIDNISIKKERNLYSIYGIIAINIIFSTILEFSFYQNITFTNLKHLNCLLDNKNYLDNFKTTNKYINNQNKNVIYLLRGNENYYFKIINNKKIDYYDLTNYGNYGYNGENKIIKKLNNTHDTIIVVDKSLCANEHNKNQQFNCDFKNAGVKNAKLIKKFNNYQIYYKK